MSDTDRLTSSYLRGAEPRSVESEVNAIMEYNGPSASRLSEEYAELYQKCQDQFNEVLAVTCDVDISSESFVEACDELTRKLERLQRLGINIARLRESSDG